MEKKPFFSNVFYIGIISFFGGISQDIFAPILPLYLTQVLDFDKSFVGFASGLVIAAVSLFRVLSGFLSDKFPKKPIIFSGYFLSMVGRVLLAFFTAPLAVLGLRFLDGAGKGLKDPAKDAVVAASSGTEKGKGFGVATALDTFGSVVGPLLLSLLLFVWAANPHKYHYILLLCAVPLIFTFFILVKKVKEVEIKSPATEKEKIKLPLQFYLFLAVILFFSLGNPSTDFLILRASNLGVSLLAIPLVYALFNFIYAIFSIPLGSLSDRIGREKVIIIGFIAYALSYFGFALATEAWQAWLLYAFYGLYFATTDGVAKAFVADIVPVEHRGKAYGVYNAGIGIMALPAGTIAGVLWDRINPAAPFYFGAGIAVASVVLMISYLMFWKRKVV
jgi:MFS family permease